MSANIAIRARLEETTIAFEIAQTGEPDERHMVMLVIGEIDVKDLDVVVIVTRIAWNALDISF